MSSVALCASFLSFIFTVLFLIMLIIRYEKRRGTVNSFSGIPDSFLISGICFGAETEWKRHWHKAHYEDL